MSRPSTSFQPSNGGHQYLPHVDGLRALAIIPVVVYHLFPALCPGGFAGVDVFFVISGYLITAGIISGLKAGQYSITDFYVRRIKRILPAYLAVIAFVLAATPLFFSVADGKSISTTAFYSIVYSANIYFYNVISYFDISARQNPLLHLWSLGVEEQFYLVIPFCIWLLWAVRKSLFIYNLILLFIASFLFSVLAINSGHSSLAFYMLPSRAWELLAGAILSQLPPVSANKPAALTSPTALSNFGLLLVGLSYVFLKDGSAFPGFAAIPSVLGSSLLIRYGGMGATNKMLSSTALVQVGKVSYSLYLWHWPIFILMNSGGSLKRAAAGIFATTIASYLSWRFIETPVRKYKPFKARHAFTMLIGGSMILASVCLSIQFVKNNNGELLSDLHGVRTWVWFEKKHDSRSSSCTFGALTNENSGLLIKIGSPKESPTFALWGDSHALALLPGADVVASDWGQSGYYINLKQNFTLEPRMGAYSYNPREDREPVFRWLEGCRSISSVLIAGRWMHQIRNQSDIEEIIRVCERLHNAGKSVYFVQSAPLANQNGLRCLSWGIYVPENMLAVDERLYNSMISESGESQLIVKLAKRGIATVLPINKAFFDGVYHTGTGSKSFYADYDHLNPIGAIQAMRYVAPIIWEPQNIH